MIGRSGRKRDLEPMADINVTSLVDVAFTLLIIFIITAPILQGGIEVEVPEAEVASLAADDNTLIVSVDREGTVYLGESPVDRTDFSQSFGQLVSGGRIERVWIQADSLAAWGIGVEIMGAVKDSGLPFAVVAQQRPQR
jgi:biopolymer transport protein TolR